ncbi:MAG: discoidin domain-containing protein, partial [Polyangiales bacterium]
HTESQASPWVAFDLLTRQTVRTVTVQNRGDCCRERAVPLVVEVSDDGAQWTEVARRDEVFDEWVATFPARTTRRLRLRALHTTSLHLTNVEIR